MSFALDANILLYASDRSSPFHERASAFLMTRQAGSNLGRIHLSGGGARIPGMAASLGRRMGVETSVVHPFERTPVHPDAALDLDLEEAAPMLLLPLGLALRAA